MAKSALILVDLQNDFLPGGALAVPQGDQVISGANALQPFFNLIVATQDSHPADHGSFASQHPGKRPGDVIELAGLSQVLWPDHCVANTPGAAFAATLRTSSITHVFPKGTRREVDSYSGFFDNQRRQATGLGDYLRARGVSDVYLLGLATDYCVKATALDAVSLGFHTHVIEDACRGVDLRPGDSERALAEMQVAGVLRVNSHNWLTPELRQTSRHQQTQLLHAGKFLQLVRLKSWEFAERIRATGVVIVVALTEQGHVLLIEQYREALGRRCIELPAGLAGDSGEAESLEDAVRRELFEETGFTPQRIEFLGHSAPSAGVTSEMLSCFLATGAVKMSDEIGDGQEEIVVHVVPWSELPSRLASFEQQGFAVATSLYAGLWLAQTWPGRSATG